MAYPNPFSEMKNTYHTLALQGILTIVFLLFAPSHQALDVNDPRAPITVPFPTVLNPRLEKAYIALQAWKHAITADPKNFTSDWYGPHVCNYTGVVCAAAPDDNKTLTVAGIDLNHAKISGYLPEDLGLLTDLAFFHINSNRFEGTVPDSFKNMRLLYELDISNNKFSGEIPSVLLSLPSLKFLDIRFNKFKGDVPSALFDLKLDALFLNDNKFRSTLPRNIGNSPVAVLVLANNGFGGCIPSSLTKMAGTLQEVILTNLSLKGCLRPEIGLLKEVTVFDISFNEISGELPESMGKMKKLEQLNVAHNKLSGYIPESICSLPRLENFTYSYNYFYGDTPNCRKLKDKDDRKNCIPERPKQRPIEECKSFYSYPIDCGSAFGCSASPPAPSTPPPRPPPPPPVHFKRP